MAAPVVAGVAFVCVCVCVFACVCARARASACVRSSKILRPGRCTCVCKKQDTNPTLDALCLQVAWLSSASTSTRRGIRAG